MDRLVPMQALSDETRCKLKETLHAAYLESSEIEDLATDLHKAALAMKEKIELFMAVWQKPLTNTNEALLRAQWQSLREKADALLTVFEKLPKGVVLP